VTYDAPKMKLLRPGRDKIKTRVFCSDAVLKKKLTNVWHESILRQRNLLIKIWTRVKPVWTGCGLALVSCVGLADSG
jgi:hypothetical protein